MPGIRNYKFVRYVWTDEEGLEEKIIGPASAEEVEKDVANIKKLNNLEHHKYTYANGTLNVLIFN